MMKSTPLLLATLLPAMGQDLLDPLFVTASRFEQPESAVPYAIDRIDSDFIRENARRTLPETLQFTPGVFVQKTAHGHGSPFIRGFTGRQNLLMFDGVRINNSTFRSGPIQYWNTVDPFSIDRLELTKSQGSVLFGSDAVGGTLNAFSKSSDFRSREDGQTYFNGSAYYEYRSNGQGSHLGRFEAETGIGGKFGIMLGLSAKDFGDIEDDAVGRMKGTGYPEENLDLRFDWAVTPDSTLTLAHYYVNQDAISRWHRTTNNPGWTHDEHFAAPGTFAANDYDQERSLTYLRYAGENPRADAAISRWAATLSWQTVNDSEFQDRIAGNRPLRAGNIDLQTFGADLQFESPVGPGVLVYGMDYYRDDVDSSGYQVNRDGSGFRERLPVADDSEYHLFGTFAQYVWKPVEPLEITAGARYTYAEATLGRFLDSNGVEQKDQSENWNSLVGSLRGLYRINECWSLFAGISQAFRAPNLDDLSGNLTSKADTTALGSPDLDPEDFLTYEIGARHSTETTSFQAAVFYTDARDLITPVPITPGNDTEIATNASDAYVYGFELEGAWRFHPQWTLSGFVSWQDARIESPEFLGGPVESKPQTRQLPLSGSLALRWTHPNERLWVESRVLAANQEDRITDEDQARDRQRIPTNGTPGYLVASLRAGWQVNDHLELTASLENLTDEDYRIHGSGQNEPGFGAVLGAKVLW